MGDLTWAQQAQQIGQTRIDRINGAHCPQRTSKINYSPHTWG